MAFAHAKLAIASSHPLGKTRCFVLTRVGSGPTVAAPPIRRRTSPAMPATRSPRLRPAAANSELAPWSVATANRDCEMCGLADGWDLDARKMSVNSSNDIAMNWKTTELYASVA
jgi:hypothetical protein